MAYNPEFDQKSISLIDAERLLLGALIRPHLRVAISKAEDEKEPIDPQKKKRLKGYFAHLDRKTNIREAHKVYCLTWEEERCGPLPEWEKLKERIIGEKGQHLKQEMLKPLYEIYTRIEGKEPDSHQPWLGRLLMWAALKKEGTEEVCLHLAKFGLDPKTLVEEVYQYLDRKLEK